MSSGLIQYNKDALKTDAENVRQQGVEKSIANPPAMSGSGATISKIDEMINVARTINQKTIELAEAVAKMLNTMGDALETADIKAGQAICTCSVEEPETVEDKGAQSFHAYSGGGGGGGGGKGF